METIITLFALTIIVMALTIQVKGRPIEIPSFRILEWLRKIAEFKF